jgi:stage V sporulation protein R
VLMAESDVGPVLQHLADLWSYDVQLKEIDRATGKALKEHRASARHTHFDPKR